MRRAVGLGLSCLVLLAAGQAQAEITYDRLSLSGDTTALIVKGEFEQSDDPSRLVSQYLQLKPSFITFQSKCGNVLAAMKFGRTIRALGADTLQIRSVECASACALAFVGGVRRSAEAGSLGVHQSSFAEDAGFDSSTAVAAVQAMTAEIIEYLGEMGVSSDLLQISLSIDRADMRYLTSSEMAQFRITTLIGPLSDVEKKDAPAAPSSPPPGPDQDRASATAPDYQAQVQQFVERYHNAWSTANGPAISFIRGAYGPQVHYYGKTVSLDDVVREKGVFADRWPKRAYSVRPGTEIVSCISSCEVTGEVEWFARSAARNKASSGIASFTMTWDPATKRILAESSKVIATDKGQMAPIRLITQWYAENDECRGSTEPESAKTKRACERRSELDAKLDRVDWCYGHQNEYGYQMRWHACDAKSNRP
ncbi:hypothetical protein [Rhizobium binxianense]|uniref:COG3904 family protein n=1 Tax=Rhizobium binxianense TaxID=3024242 RepID=UPI00234FA73E|nr:hypothetical protein [Rhizobium sp. BC56]MDC7742572.1 hypothetical protein [Rhizobium sp. BC56]